VTVPATGVTPGPANLNVAPFIVVGSIARLNVAETVVLSATAVARFAGIVEIIVGATSVVKVHTKLASSGLAAGSCAPVVIVAVYRVLAARTVAGVKVAVDPEYVTTPTTGVAPGFFTVNVAPLIVAGFMASLKVAETRVLTATATAPAEGTVEITAGPVVVKLQTKLLISALPPGSVAPVVIVATNKVLAASVVVGVKVAVAPLRVTDPATAPPGPVTVKDAILIDAGAITVLKVAVTVLLRATFTAPLSGVTEVTVGGNGLGVRSRPHPAIRRADRTTGIQILINLSLRIASPLHRVTELLKTGSSRFRRMAIRS
jgi:hypothetical protein